MNDVLTGNILALCAAVTDSVSGTRKTTKAIMGLQTISLFFYAAGNLVLRGYSAVVQNVVSVGRNLLAASGKKIAALEWLLTIAAIVLGIYFNNRGVIGLLPVVANGQYTICIFRFKDQEWKLKISFTLVQLMFIVFNLYILNFVGAAMGIAIGGTTVASLIRERKAAKAEKNETGENGDE